MGQELDLLLEKACSTPEGQLKATFILSELEKLAPAFYDETTREAAEEALTKWADIGGCQLRKGMATEWLSRARSALMPHVADALSGATNGVNAVRHAAGAVKGAVGRAQNAAGDLGAAAGEKIANSRLGAGRMAEIRAKGGAKAQARMADRLKPQQSRVEPFYQQEASPSGRLDAGGSKAPVEPFFEHEASPAGRLESSNPHAEALAAAFRQGADHAARIHAKASARVGRIAARHAFKAGAMLGAAGTGVAAAGAIAGRLSEKQRQQRVEAGKHSHQGHQHPHQGEGAPRPGSVRRMSELGPATQHFAREMLAEKRKAGGKS